MRGTRFQIIHTSDPGRLPDVMIMVSMSYSEDLDYWTFFAPFVAVKFFSVEI